MHIPTVLGAVVPVYNIPGVTSDLKFSGDVIADIYLGKITNWNDPRIVKPTTPASTCPTIPSFPSIVRTAPAPPTSSPTSSPRSALTSSPKIGKSTSVKWPIGIGQKGNEGVAGMVRQSPYSFGYVELIYAVAEQDAVRLGQERRRQVHQGQHRGRHRRRCRQRPRPCPPTIRVSITNAAGADLLPDLPLHLAADPDPVRPTRPRARPSPTSSPGCSTTAKRKQPAMTYAPLPAPVQDAVRKTIAQIK